jgi:hypothetical protein
VSTADRKVPGPKRIENVPCPVDRQGEARSVPLSGRELTLSAVARHEDLLQPFPIAGDLLIPAGARDFVTGRISFAPAHATLLRLSASAEAGTCSSRARGR